MNVPLRFDVPFIPASWIAEQYYCEKKVELRLLHGLEAETEATRMGREAHEELAEQALPGSSEEIARRIRRGERILVREMPLEGVLEGVPLVGFTDAVLFEGGKPLCVFEYKFGRSARPWRSHHIQAQIYGLLLHLSGFATDRLHYALVYAPPEEREALAVAEGRVIEALRAGERRSLRLEVEGGRIRVWVTPFDLSKARENAMWALGFWKGEREAIPTTRAAKCRACEFQAICPASQVR